MKSITLLDIGMAEDGHRAAYVAFLSRLFALERMGFCSRAVLSRHPVLVPMIEESFFIYAITAIIRCVLGRRTAGLLFRPLPALEGKGLRLKTKLLLLKTLRRLPGVATLTILPFELKPEFATIADGWIHDPQLWDLDHRQATTASADAKSIASQVREAAGGRRVCVALGRQDRGKGFDWFTDLYANDSSLRADMLFVFGGKAHQEVQRHLARFRDAGGLSYDRFVTDEELLALYDCADLVWCAYDPAYDQASGILGRAAQLGIPVVVRDGSLSHLMCERQSIPHIALSLSDTASKLSRNLTYERDGDAEFRTQRMRAESLANLHVALGFLS